MSMCRVVSCVVGRWRLLWPVYSLGRTLLAFALLLSVLQGQICLLLLAILPGISWLPTFAFQSRTMKRSSFLDVSSTGLVGLHRTVQLQLLQFYLSGHRLGSLWYGIVCLETNRDHCVVFEISSKYSILDSFVDHDGYSISSKGFFPTVVDIMLIWVKFTHSNLF